ncbi:MAG: diaminopimelate epimerase [Erysipelotrichia bacterium]|nr:diaminopimelate epimerase [Erysipelotrichia bacterium]NCC55228.1 diaminopimelate epimerase [Erysipelotrichia bacterium]
MTFAKYHGCGNNFVLVDYEDLKSLDLSKLAIHMCDMHVGIGADGLIVVKQAPLEMIFYNQDGSRAQMCGNGIRCFAKYVCDKNIVCENKFNVQTLAGTMRIEVVKEPKFKVKVNMGKPSYALEKLNLAKYVFDIKDYMIDDYHLSSVYMGVIHTVMFVDSIDSIDVEKIGSYLCHHAMFKEQTNVNFVEIMGESNIRVITYERGVGISKACGTGCCASVVIANEFHKVGDVVNVHLELGKLKITYRGEDVYMEGPAEKIAEGMCTTYKED